MNSFEMLHSLILIIIQQHNQQHCLEDTSVTFGTFFSYENAEL